jgi:hypothetical protein
MPASAAFILFSLLAGNVEALSFTIQDWPEPRRAEALAAYPPLRVLVGQMEAQPEPLLLIRHAGGEAGSGFAQAVRAALVALGVPSARIALEPEPGEADRLIITLSSSKISSP